MDSALREVPPDDFLQKGNILRIFLGLTRQLETMPEGLLRELLHHFPVRLPIDKEGNMLVSEEDKFRFGEARPGDHLFCPFQCELCHFRNIQGRSPMMGTVLQGNTELMK
jgi:hypothetical protein